MKLRFYLALIMAKLSIPALKITGHNGTDFPGSLALRICPDFLAHINKPEKIIVVTGTNGKTTTSNMIKDCLAKLGVDVLNNSKGSNIASGISTILLKGVSLANRPKHKLAVLEVDERSAARIFPYVVPDIMIVTNLARDSIMRNAHPEYIKWFLDNNLPSSTKLLLNADDMVSMVMGADNEKVFYGIDRLATDTEERSNLLDDLQICPVCHSRLEYDYYRYSNTGRVRCPSCGFHSPEFDYLCTDADFEKLSFEFVEHGVSCGSFRMMSDSIFNLYNQLSVMVLLRELGYSIDEVRKAFEGTGITSSRYYHRQVGDMNIYRFFAKEKNAFASCRVFEHLHSLPGDKEIVLFNNCRVDVKEWSESVAWMFDCDFELLNDDRIKQIIVYGDRRFDYRLRLRLAGIPEERITMVEDPHEASSKLCYFAGDNIYILYGADSVDLGIQVEKEIAPAAEAAFTARAGKEKA